MMHSIVNLSYLMFLSILLFFLTMPQIGAENSNQSMKMDEIVITPGKFSIVDRIRSNLTLSKKEIDNFPLIDNDIMRSAQIFPGVISNDLEKLMVRVCANKTESIRLFINVDLPPILGPVIMIFLAILIELLTALFGSSTGFHKLAIFIPTDRFFPNPFL